MGELRVEAQSSESSIQVALCSCSLCSSDFFPVPGYSEHFMCMMCIFWRRMCVHCAIALGISVGSFSLDCWILLGFCCCFCFSSPPQTTDMDVTKLFLCSSVVVLGTINKFTSRGAGSAMEKVGLITTCRENKKSSSSDIPGNSHLGYCWQRDGDKNKAGTNVQPTVMSPRKCHQLAGKLLQFAAQTGFGCTRFEISLWVLPNAFLSMCGDWWDSTSELLGWLLGLAKHFDYSGSSWEWINTLSWWKQTHLFLYTL